MQSFVENEVKMTIIATGFPSTEVSHEKDTAVTAAVGKLTNDMEAIELPPFLRHHRSARRRNSREWRAASD